MVIRDAEPASRVAQKIALFAIFCRVNPSSRSSNLIKLEASSTINASAARLRLAAAALFELFAAAAGTGIVAADFGGFAFDGELDGGEFNLSGTAAE